MREEVVSITEPATTSSFSIRDPPIEASLFCGKLKASPLGSGFMFIYTALSG